MVYGIYVVNHLATQTQYTRCDLVAYDLVASYGIESCKINSVRHIVCDV